MPAKKKKTAPSPAAFAPGNGRLAETLTGLAEDSLIFADEASPFSAAVRPGEPCLVVVTGENASGKSILVRSLAIRMRGAGQSGGGEVAQDSAKPTVISLSIRERIESGIKRAFMYGDEHDRSTGATSVRTTRAAIEHNLDRPEGSLLILDEPEIGLAESYATAYGRYLATAALAAPAVCHGFVIVTHSRALVAGICEVTTPTFAHTAVRPSDADGNPIGTGTHPASVSEWLTGTEEHTIEDLLALPEVETERWRQVHQLLDSAR